MNLAVRIAAARPAPRPRPSRKAEPLPPTAHDLGVAEGRLVAARIQEEELATLLDQFQKLGQSCPTCSTKLDRRAMETLRTHLFEGLDVIRVDLKYWQGRVAQLSAAGGLDDGTDTEDPF